MFHDILLVQSDIPLTEEWNIVKEKYINVSTYLTTNFDNLKYNLFTIHDMHNCTSKTVKILCETNINWLKKYFNIKSKNPVCYLYNVNYWQGYYEDNTAMVMSDFMSVYYQQMLRLIELCDMYNNCIWYSDRSNGNGIENINKFISDRKKNNITD